MSKSQPSSEYSGIVARLRYQHALSLVLGQRVGLSSVTDAASARNWVAGFGVAVVRLFCRPVPRVTLIGPSVILRFKRGLWV